MYVTRKQLSAYFGLSETKLKSHRLTSCLILMASRNLSGKIMTVMAVELLSCMFGIASMLNADSIWKRKNISCIWLEITVGKSKPFLIGNMYRPPNSKVEFIDRFEIIIDIVSHERREMILLGDFNKNLLNEHKYIEWDNFVTSLGLSQLVCDPTRVTNTSRTLIDHIYTNFDENIAHVHVCKTSISDHFAFFGNPKLNNCVKSNTHQTFTYWSFKNFDDSSFISDMHGVS